MATFTPDAMAFAAFMLTGKMLEKLQEKGILFEDEATSAIGDAVKQMMQSGNPQAVDAAQVLLHFYGPPAKQS
jgi:hypothetical protein